MDEPVTCPTRSRFQTSQTAQECDTSRRLHGISNPPLPVGER